MKVNRLPFDPGPAAWNAILPPADPFPALAADVTADWLIVGAGFAGLSAARRLKQLRPEDSIAVVEARRVAEGPAGRNSGFMVDLPHDLASDDYGGEVAGDLRQISQNRAAIAFAADAQRDYAMADEAFRQSGKTNAAASGKGTKHNRDFARHLDALNEPYTHLDARQMRAMTGTDFYESGLYTPGAAMLQPALYIRGLASGLVRDGVDLFEDSPVTALERNGADWRATTPSGSVTAARAILAVNGHAESFGFFQRRLMHVFTFASMTRELTADEAARLGGEPVWGCTPADPLGTTVRKVAGVGGHRIVVRNTFAFEPDMAVSERRLRAVWRDHDRSYARRFPMLRDVAMDYRWGGMLCLARNAVSAVKRLDDGLVSAVCQNGLGTTKGTFAGMMAAEIIAGEPSGMAEDLLAEPLPVKLPPKQVADIGANAYIRWGEWKAGVER
jgi:glycine/D-amino acid oxidase-like deaminating enzyme